MPIILYTSDLHGNEIQYKKLIDFAIRLSVDFVVIGGDIAPKDSPLSSFIDYQRKFFKEKLLDLLLPLKEKLSNCKLFLMMGNDDCSVNMDILNSCGRHLFYLLHNKRYKLTEKIDIVGYSYVPINPFSLKDWQKYDFSSVPYGLREEYAGRKIREYALKGIKSRQGGFNLFEFDVEIEKKDSIQKDLRKRLYTKEPRKTIYVMHSPPNKTHLDITSAFVHVGSLAIRFFIEKYQPYLTLHGHIHETVDISGKFMHKLEKTLCLTSGNDNHGNKLALLVIDVDNPEKTKRQII